MIDPYYDPYHIDWAARWREQVAAEQAQFDSVITPSQQTGDFWGPQAARFRAARGADGPAPRDARLMAKLRTQLIPTQNGFRSKTSPQLAVLSWQKM